MVYPGYKNCFPALTHFCASCNKIGDGCGPPFTVTEYVLQIAEKHRALRSSANKRCNSCTFFLQVTKKTEGAWPRADKAVYAERKQHHDAPCNIVISLTLWMASKVDDSYDAFIPDQPLKQSDTDIGLRYRKIAMNSGHPDTLGYMADQLF